MQECIDNVKVIYTVFNNNGYSNGRDQLIRGIRLYRYKEGTYIKKERDRITIEFTETYNKKVGLQHNFY